MDVYSIITERIINLLEQGTVPWRQPWVVGGPPQNLVSKRPYRGINHFLVSFSKHVSPYWLTMRQANQLGGHIRSGEEGTPLVFWKTEGTHAKRNDSEEAEADHTHRRRFVLRYYRVWNLEQCELPRALIEKLPTIETYQHEPIAAVETLLAHMPNPPTVEHAGTCAFYCGASDRITLPPRDLFVSAEEYSATLLHEITHSTGHPKRLDRESIHNGAVFGSATYSKEELIAEMGAAYLCSAAGISNAVIGNQASYVAGWLRRLRDDRKLLVQAATQAQRAADYVLAKSDED